MTMHNKLIFTYAGERSALTERIRDSLVEYLTVTGDIHRIRDKVEVLIGEENVGFAHNSFNVTPPNEAYWENSMTLLAALDMYARGKGGRISVFRETFAEKFCYMFEAEHPEENWE